MANLNLLPAAIDIAVTRGDTLAFTFAIKDSAGAALNIAGFTFVLTVDPSEEPTTAAANLFALAGTITDAPGGIVEFAMTALQADKTPNVYFYDLQMVDGSARIRTVAKGRFEFRQDITK